ncbi:MAG: hypothetical protein ACYTGG_01505 [Planctomycetota bacterium]|jgi:hypothetical protein
MSDGLMRWLLDIDVIPAGAEGLRLAWERPWAGWVWALLILLAIAFAGWSYSRITGGRTSRVILAGLRCALVILVLVVISGPMLELPRETVEQDWVLVLADRSESMTIADAAVQGSARLTRDRQLQDLLDGAKPTLDRLAHDRHVVWMGFHTGAFELPVTTRGGTDDDVAALEIDLGEATGRRTNLGAAMQQAVQRAAARPLSGIVIFSDGRTSDPPSRALVRRLQSDAVPIFVVPLGSADSVGDLAVRRVDAPRRAFVRDKVPVVVEIDQTGAAPTDRPFTVKLVDEVTGEELDRVDLPAGSDTDSITLTAEPALAGEATWRVVVDSGETDLIPENNIKAFRVELIDRPLRVLLVEGYPRWEYRYLKNLLVREKSIESSVMLISADRDFAQEGNQPITRLPRSPEEFAEFDVIILGDAPGQFFSPDQLEMMRAHVAERGAGLLWIAGERYLPRTYAGTALADLLPMRGSLTLGGVGVPVNMTPTTLAERRGVLRLATGDQIGWPRELEDPAYGWSMLYFAQRIEPGRLKPTVEVLAETTTAFNGEPLPLVTHMRYGAGRIIYVATDEIWRWRFGRGELLPEQFWVQMIRMLGREALASSEDAATLEVSPRRLQVNQPLRLELQLLDTRLAQAGRETVSAVLEDDAGRVVAEIELKRTRGAGERYAATYLPRVSGLLTVRIDDPTLEDVALQAEVEVFTPDDELRRPETDHPLLADLAATTGGSALAAADLERLPDLLPNRSVRTLNPLTERIWDTPLFFGLILLLATLEWVGRKVIRLA